MCLQQSTGNSRLSGAVVMGMVMDDPKTTVKTKAVKTWYEMDLM
jgi:hypothetical protein